MSVALGDDHGSTLERGGRREPVEEQGARGAAAAADAALPWPAAVVERDLKRARSEWLHTNGAGAYASSTVACMHTRRYHGLLVATLDPPGGRHVFLAHMDATVTPATVSGPASRPLSRPKWELGKHQFPGVDPEVTPFHLQRFDQDPLPRWTYHVAGGELEVTLALVRGENAVVLRYAFRGPGPVLLTLRPLLAARDYHHLLREHGGMLQRVELRPGIDGEPLDPGRAHDSSAPAAGEMRVQPRRDLPRICFRYEGTFVGSPDWWRRFEYLTERDRGLDYQEDLWTPGLFEIPLDSEPRYLVAAVDRLPVGEPSKLLEAARIAILAEDPGPAVAPLARRLTLAAEVFRADLARRPGVVAGYPWFEGWTRDTLAALPGLYLVPRKIDGALRILREVIGAMSDGLVPSRFPARTSPSLGAAASDAPPGRHAVDATLWLFEAARHVAGALGDHHPFVTGEMLPALREAFEAARRGTRYGVHVTAEGLFAAGAPGDSPTWMDARVEGLAVTSRAGCPIELTALWARGCDTLAHLARAAGDLPLHDRAAVERDRARHAFAARFWCAETGYPYDVVSPARAGEGSFCDASIRPNAVLALALDPECFTPEQADAVLARARRDLVTPAGLRTLAPGEPGYAAHYVGNVAARAGAYHQGTIWPWLLGAYVRAALRRGAAPAELLALVTTAAGNALALGHVPELADGDPPHTPRGCPAQAWSVAELLRALEWDLR
jgi:predicted glycogen debranching enzyme